MSDENNFDSEISKISSIGYLDKRHQDMLKNTIFVSDNCGKQEKGTINKPVNSIYKAFRLINIRKYLKFFRGK